MTLAKVSAAPTHAERQPPSTEEIEKFAALIKDVVNEALPDEAAVRQANCNIARLKVAVADGLLRHGEREDAARQTPSPARAEEEAAAEEAAAEEAAAEKVANAPDAASRTTALLDRLFEEARKGGPLPSLPVKAHAERLGSGARGLSLPALHGLRAFYAAQAALGKQMSDVCKEAGFGASVCALTRRSGLSLAETLVLADGAGAAAGIVGETTSFFSYSWTGTELGDMLEAIDRLIGELEAAGDGGERYVWVDMFAASQNLLGGVYRDAAITDKASPEHKARKEDTDALFDGALESAREVLYYASPLLDEWKAPPHPFLSEGREAVLWPERGAAPEPWMRKGPCAITRAWCLFELTTCLELGKTLHVALSAADHAEFERLLREDFAAIAGIVAGVDARDAQISKVDDREYILARVGRLADGLGTVTARVAEALRAWLLTAARRALDALPAAERGTSVLLDSMARLLQAKGELCRARYGRPS